MSGSRVRFAILGFGHHAVRRLVPSFPMSERAELVGLWRRDAAAGARNAEEFGIRHSFRSREELCASPEVDAVFITSPDAMHRDDTLLALRHGKAVLCEKPLAMNAAEAAEMEAAAGRAGLLFGVAQNFRWNRSMEWIRERVDAGAIGEVQMAHAEFSYPAQTAPRKWITDPALATGGPIGDVGVHCLDALRFALRQDPVTVSTLARQDALSGAVEAWASMQFGMSGGAFATVATSARASYRTLVEITGSEGALVAESALTVDRPVEVRRLRAGEMVEQLTVSNADGYARMLDAFTAAMGGGEAFRASGADGVMNMRAIDAAYKSWRSGLLEQV